MIFQNPSLLWALSALAIPIVIHLFHFRKTTNIYFSNTRLLHQIKQTIAQKRKLKQYLVLLSRLLFLFFLVIAFSQPFIPAKEQIHRSKKIAIYLDNSLSMSAPVTEKWKALDDAVQKAQHIVSFFPADVQYQIITNDFDSFSYTYKTKQAVIDYLSHIRLSPISRGANEIITRLLNDSRTFFWVSDLQRSTFGHPTFIDSTLQINVVPIALDRQPNVWVDTVYLEKSFSVDTEKNTLQVHLRQEGPRKIEKLICTLMINGNQSAVGTVTLTPQSTSVISFDIPETLQNVDQCVINFRDHPISFDNEFYFIIRNSRPLKVVEIKNRNETTVVEKVYGNKKLFTFSALQASNLNYSLLKQVDLIVVNQLNEISPPLLSELNHLKEKCAILLIPDLQPSKGMYRELLNKETLVNENEKPMPLDEPDFDSPFFQQIFEQKNSNISMPRVTKRLDWGTDRSAILLTQDGRPFLSNNNGVFVMACALVNQETDLHNHALFVPVMYQLAAARRPTAQGLYQTLSTTRLSVQADSLSAESPIQIKGYHEIVPIQRRLGNQVILEPPKFLLDKGFYTILHKKDTLDVVAFNLTKSESFLEPLTIQETTERLGGKNVVSIFNPNDIEKFQSELNEQYLGQPLWKFALMLSLLFLLIEILLLRFLN